MASKYTSTNFQSPYSYDGLKQNSNVHIIQQKTKTFKFINEFEKINEYSMVKVNFIENYYPFENNYYYHISYDIEDFKDGSKVDNFSLRSNPFYGFDSEKVSSLVNGEQVLKNEFTLTLVKHLLFDDTELEKYTGRSTSQFYRRSLMISLDNFWD